LLPGARAAARSTGTLGAAAQTADISANPPTPARNNVRRPITSASRPEGASRAAKVVAYAVITHDNVDTLVCGYARPSAGIARFTTVTSSRARNAAPAASNSTRADWVIEGSWTRTAQHESSASRSQIR
jgi:hypothetical protein